MEDWKIPRWQSCRGRWESVRECEWGVGLSGKNIEKKGRLRPLYILSTEKRHGVLYVVQNKDNTNLENKLRNKILDFFLVRTYSFSKKCHILKSLLDIFGFLYLLVS